MVLGGGCKLWGSNLRDLGSNPVIYPCLTLTKLTQLLRHSVTSAATRAGLETVGHLWGYALGIISNEFFEDLRLFLEQPPYSVQQKAWLESQT